MDDWEAVLDFDAYQVSSCVDAHKRSKYLCISSHSTIISLILFFPWERDTHECLTGIQKSHVFPVPVANHC